MTKDYLELANNQKNLEHYFDLVIMSNASRKVRDIIKADHILTFGYMRTAAKRFTHLNIPQCVWMICYLFAVEYDEFAECGFALKINKSKDICTNVGSSFGRGNVYGKLHIGNKDHSSAFIYEWKFKILHYNPSPANQIGNIAIGIVDANYNNLGPIYYGECSDVTDNWHIAVRDDGAKFDTICGDYYGVEMTRSIISYMYILQREKLYSIGDEIAIIYDGRYEMLEFIFNNAPRIKSHVHFQTADMKYKIAIFMSTIGAKVKLIKFNKYPHNVKGK